MAPPMPPPLPLAPPQGYHYPDADDHNYYAPLNIFDNAYEFGDGAEAYYDADGFPLYDAGPFHGPAYGPGFHDAGMVRGRGGGTQGAPKPAVFDEKWPPTHVEAWLEGISDWIRRTGGELRVDLPLYLSLGSKTHLWFTRLRDCTAPRNFTDTFVRQQFLSHFAPRFSTIEQDAHSDLLHGRIKQGELRVERFATEFATTVREAGDLRETQKVQLFLNGLRPD